MIKCSFIILSPNLTQHCVPWISETAKPTTTTTTTTTTATTTTRTTTTTPTPTPTPPTPPPPPPPTPPTTTTTTTTTTTATSLRTFKKPLQPSTLVRYILQPNILPPRDTNTATGCSRDENLPDLRRSCGFRTYCWWTKSCTTWDG